MLSIEFSTKVTQVALDLPSLFKETTPSPHPPPPTQSLYRYGTMYMYVQLQAGQENFLPYSVKMSSACASGVFIQS